MKKLFLLLMAMILSTGMWALDNVPYVDVDGTTKYANNVTVITGTSKNLTEGWYVVMDTVRADSLICDGAVKLILADGAQMTSIGGEGYTEDKMPPAIKVSGDGNSLTIYGQANQSGELIAKGGYMSSGIGGTVSAPGQNIYIYGGIVTATGQEFASAIGGGYLSWSTDIYVHSSLALVADNDSTLTRHIWHTTDQDVSAMLYRQRFAKIRPLAKNMVVTLDQQGGTGGTAQITVDECADMPTIVVPTSTREGYTFVGYYAGPNGTGTKYYNADGTGIHYWDQAENDTLYAHWGELVDYIDVDGSTKRAGIDGEITSTTADSTTLLSGWYIVRGEDVRTNTLICDGDVHLILADGAQLTATGYSDGRFINCAAIRVSGQENTLTIYGQKAQTGQLVASAKRGSAAIGGDAGQEGNTITINGGVIKAQGGDGYFDDVAQIVPGGSGIGGGNYSKGRVVINGGDVTSKAGDRYAVGIGGDDSSYVEINGGKVFAEGPTGGFCSGKDSKLYINADSLLVKADNTNPPTTRYAVASGANMAPTLAGKRYVSIEKDPNLHHIPYVDENGKDMMVDGVIELFDSSEPVTLYDGWYAARGNVTFSEGIICNGVVHLILVDDFTLTATGANEYAGIQVTHEKAALHIYGQAQQTGQLIAQGGENAAGIGGIPGAAGRNITIHSGVVIATGGNGGAGIGSSQTTAATKITILGGAVTATGGSGAFGIGSGHGSQSTDVLVSDRLILKADNATNPPMTIIRHKSHISVADEIAGKQYVTVKKPVRGLTITINHQGGVGGSEQVVVDEGAAMPQITVSTRKGYALQGYYSDKNGEGELYYHPDGSAAALCNFTEDTTIYAYWKTTVSYVDVDGIVKYVNAEELHSQSKVLESKWYVVTKPDLQLGTLECNGQVKLILADGAKLTVNGKEDNNPGIRVCSEDVSLTIYGQTRQTGQLIATGGRESAGIGGMGSSPTGYNITINGGIVTATGGDEGAGIGGGKSGEGRNIAINGGVITAKGGNMCAAIGGGNNGAGRHITINGGVIEATGGNGGAGIGGGSKGAGDSITIYGGVITAKGGYSAAAIGGGVGVHVTSDTSRILIYGGKIYATTKLHDGSNVLGNGKASNSTAEVYIHTSLILKAENNTNPTKEIVHTTEENLASKLAGLGCATIALPTVAMIPAPEQHATYGTFYHEKADYIVPDEDAIIYTASLMQENNETKVVRHEMYGHIIPAGTPVIISADTSSTIELRPCEDASEVLVPENDLIGANLPMDRPTTGTTYMLSSKTISGETEAMTAFHRYTEDTIPEHTAYLLLPGGQPTPERITWGHLSPVPPTPTKDDPPTVSFEHNDWRSYQANVNTSQMTLSAMSIPHDVNTSSCNSDWAKVNLENYSGDLPQSATSHQQMMHRYNNAWLAAYFFDWFSLEFKLPEYTQYQYQIHFQMMINKGGTGSALRAVLYHYGTDYARWSSRDSIPNGETSFYTSLDNLAWDETKPGELCAVRMASSTEQVIKNCDVPVTVTNNGPSAKLKSYFAYSSSRSLESKNNNYYHNNRLYASYTAELVGYVKHVVYHANVAGIADQEDDIVTSGVLRGDVLTREGYTIQDWNTQPDYRGTTYHIGDTITVDKSTRGELVLYARWKPNQYTVMLNKQGGAGGTDSVVVTAGSTMPAITVPSRGMANFLGYFSRPMGKGTRYYNANGTSARNWNITEQPHLYAHWSDGSVYYVDEEGLNQTVDDYTLITNESKTLSAGWYVLADTAIETGELICDGDVRLILMDGTRMTCRGGQREAGFRVTGSSTLTIFGQKDNSGELFAYGGYFGAGIGGNSVSGSNVTIYGGSISAYGGQGGAGIGGGNWGDGSYIAIYGGTVNAVGDGASSGIGGGFGGAGRYIYIHGGLVTATGGGGGSGMGSGTENGSSNNIYVTSSLMLCVGNDNPPTTYIDHTSDTDVTGLISHLRFAVIKPYAKNLVVTFDRQGGVGGTEQLILNNGDPMPNIDVPTREGFVFRGYYAGPDGAGLKYYDAEGVSTYTWTRQENTTLYALWGEVIAYVDVDGTTKYVDVRSIITSKTTTLKNDWYAVRGEDVRTGGLNCSGDVHLILMDGAKLTATGNAGIVVYKGNTLTIYGQEEQSGQLIATATGSGAGIGSSGINGDITINGGVITATATGGGAGIGGGNGGYGINITINRGHVTATGGEGAAGIGGGSGRAYYGSNITINGGVVKATGGNQGAGIGGGSEAYGRYIFINGGDVTAVGGNDGAGIGGGLNDVGEKITINGGRISATGGTNAAGIGGGGGEWGHGSDIRINGGEITANGGVNASAIGGGSSYTDKIFVSSSLILKADNNNPPTTVIAHTSSDDLGEKVHRQRYATTELNAITVVTRYAEDKDAYYGTYYNSKQAYKVVTEGVTMYTASLETAGVVVYLDLHEIEGDILPAGTAVVIRSEKEEKVLLAYYDGSTKGVFIPANSLRGEDEETMTALYTGTLYLLSVGEAEGDKNVTAFYRYSEDILPAHTAYLQRYMSTLERIDFGKNVPTGVMNDNDNANDNANENANANKVLRQGVLYIISNERVYNTQGVLIRQK